MAALQIRKIIHKLLTEETCYRADLSLNITEKTFHRSKTIKIVRINWEKSRYRAEPYIFSKERVNDNNG
ncbi:MAG: hypothetical protein F6J93_36700 [Oscillatoria sp. SIO1A7]|nr:hypothetical protein [Oscillatoria sp. SIO1A7]